MHLDERATWRRGRPTAKSRGAELHPILRSAKTGYTASSPQSIVRSRPRARGPNAGLTASSRDGRFCVRGGELSSSEAERSHSPSVRENYL